MAPTSTDPGRLSKMKFEYENVEVLFIDEISMVGSMKLSKINFRLQDIAEAESKLRFMGEKSVVASGNRILIKKTDTNHQSIFIN